VLIVAPALAALIAAGATLIGEALPSSFDPSEVAQLRIFAALLCAWTVGALLVNLLLPALFALGRARLVNALAPAILVLHLGLTALGGLLFGANGVVAAFCLVPLGFAALLLVLGAGRGAAGIAVRLAIDGLRFGLAAALAFGFGAAVGSALASGIAAPLVTVTVGSVLYLLATARLAPDQVRLLIGAVRPASA
jgi:hypothetical protein